MSESTPQERIERVLELMRTWTEEDAQNPGPRLLLGELRCPTCTAVGEATDTWEKVSMGGPRVFECERGHRFVEGQ